MRLRQRLEAAVAAPLTLVTAPPGGGKTLLLLDWAAEHDGELVWVTLEAAMTGPDLAQQLTAAVGGDARVGGLRGALDSRTTPIVVVLDDAHEVASTELGAVLRDVVGHPALRLVLGTRVDPDLPLHRLRVAGSLAELRADELAFTAAEAADLLGGHGVALDPATLELLLGRTEGWAAGLRLAALLLEDHAAPEDAVREFAGDDRAVVAYLIHEVLDRQPAAVRELLIRTAVADRVSGELADALTGEEGGQAILERLVAANAFVVPLDRRGRWFRYHAMFGDLLRALLRQRGADAWAEQQRRAARFFHDAGDVDRALVHAAEAGDWDLLDATLRERWPALRADGRAALLDRVLARVPAAAFARRPQLAIVAAARALDRDDPAACDALLAVAEVERGGLAGHRREHVTRDLALVRLEAAVRRGEAGVARRAGATVLSLARDDDPAGPQIRALALLGLGHISVADGEPDAEARLRQAAAGARAYGPPLVAERADALRAWRYALDGHVRQAGLAVQATPVVALVEGRLAQSLVAAETGDLTTAHAALQDAAALCAPRGASGRLRALELEVARCRTLRLAGSDAQQAMLSALDRLLDGWSPPRRLAAAALAARIRLLVALGRTAAAVDAARHADGSRFPDIALARAATFLAVERPAAAYDAALAVTRGALQVPATVAAFALAAGAADADGRRTLAVAAAERALDLAEPDGLRLAVVDAFPHIEPVLRHLLRFGTAHRALIGDVLQLAMHGHQPAAPAAVAPLVATLSERELVVLRHLPTMLTSQEIAGELFVTLNTVKSHLRAIYRKLDVNGRRDAVERARALGLLAPGSAGGPPGRLPGA